MKRVEVEVKKYKTVEDGTQIIEMYETEDGKKFKTIDEANSHQKEIITKEVKKLPQHLFSIPNLEFLYCTFYYVSDKEDLELIKKYLSSYNEEIHGELKIGEWIGRYEEYDAYYNSTVTHILTLSYLKNELEGLLNQINSIK
jgi:hypothetical protein